MKPNWTGEKQELAQNLPHIQMQLRVGSIILIKNNNDYRVLVLLLKKIITCIYILTLTRLTRGNYLAKGMGKKKMIQITTVTRGHQEVSQEESHQQEFK